MRKVLGLPYKKDAARVLPYKNTEEFLAKTSESARGVNASSLTEWYKKLWGRGSFREDWAATVGSTDPLFVIHQNLRLLTVNADCRSQSSAHMGHLNKYGDTAFWMARIDIDEFISRPRPTIPLCRFSCRSREGT